MDMNNYKRDFKYRSDEGNNKGFTYLIIACAIVVVALAFFMN